MIIEQQLKIGYEKTQHIIIFLLYS